MKNSGALVLSALVGAVMFFAGRGCAVSGVDTDGGGVTVRVDTVVVRDTIRDAAPVARLTAITRVDTVFVRVAGDTVRMAGDTVYVAAELPVERKTYLTADYRAVVEGFRPSLVGVEVYRRTQFIDRVRTVAVPDARRWSIGVQAGWGFSPKGAAPYVGVGVGYRVVAW